MDDDDFSDDGFDDLNDTVLQELETRAIQSTQARLASTQQQPPQQPTAPVQRHHQAPRPQRQQQQQQQQQQHQQQQQRQLPQAPPRPRRDHDNYGYGLEDDDLDDTVVFEEISQQPRGNVAAAAAAETSRSVQPARLSANVVAKRAAYTARAPYPTSRPPHQQSQFVPRAPPQPSQFARHAQPPPSQFARQSLPVRPTHGAQPIQAAHAAINNGKPDDVVSALQARLSELESELTTAKGEAAIMRSKYDKAQTEREADIARLKKQAAEQIAKQERILEEARAAQRTANTELQFARQDLREGMGRTRNKRQDGTATTPKKSNKTWGQPDGFDSLEVMSTSPSKGHAAMRRHNSGPSAQPAIERTPTKGKRKRPAVDSPSFALETHEAESGFTPKKSIDPVFLPARPTTNDLPFDFLRLILEHNALSNQPPTFDLFSRFAYPSEPSRTFAAMIFQKLPRLGNAKEPIRLLSDFAQMILDMWQRCLAERYHSPIYYLASLVRYTLDLNAVAVAPHIISTLIPVCTTTCRLVAQPRYNSADGNLSAHPDNVIRQLCLDIDVTQCLTLLHLAALGCVAPTSISHGDDSGADAAQPQYSPQVQFWRTIEPDFILMMLSPKHPERDWFGTISMLWSSVLPESVGPIPTKVSMAAMGRASTKRSEADDLAEVAAGVIGRVSSFLTDMPGWAERGSVKELKVRWAALRTLVIFASSPFGAMQIAEHEAALPRVVTVWAWAVNRSYDVDGGLPRRKPASRSKDPVSAAPKTNTWDAMDVDSFAEADDDDDDYGSDWTDEAEDEGAQLAAQLPKVIAEATRLLHTLITSPHTADVANITDKLTAWPGGSQRYFLTLARLSVQEEDLIMDVRIPAETAELASELLRMVVNMEDAEHIQEAFNVTVQA